MEIIDYIKLIKELPVKQHSITTKYKIWENALAPNIPEEVRELFGGEDKKNFSREEILIEENIKKKIYMTIFWGYPHGMQHNYHSIIFDRVEQINNILGNRREINNWDEYKQDLSALCPGVSTFSKLLYFNNSKIGENKAIILDSRIINCFKQEVFEEFHCLSHITYHNAPRYYLDYLIKVKEIAQLYDVTEEQIELFLFLFGNNLKEH